MNEFINQPVVKAIDSHYNPIYNKVRIALIGADDKEFFVQFVDCNGPDKE